MVAMKQSVADMTEVNIDRLTGVDASGQGTVISPEYRRLLTSSICVCVMFFTLTKELLLWSNINPKKRITEPITLVLYVPNFIYK